MQDNGRVRLLNDIIDAGDAVAAHVQMTNAGKRAGVPTPVSEESLRNLYMAEVAVVRAVGAYVTTLADVLTDGISEISTGDEWVRAAKGLAALTDALSPLIENIYYQTGWNKAMREALLDEGSQE